MEVTLLQMLDARENRVRKQTELLSRFRKPLICFTMNIAGPEKNNPLITEGFRMGQALAEAQLAGLPVLHREEVLADTGCEGYYVVDADTAPLKALMAEIEDASPVGRLFDLDVLDLQGKKVCREALGLPGRKCLICGNPVYLCSSRRSHSVEALQDKTRQLLLDALRHRDALTLGALAVQSLLYEVSVTPKPGLVDRENSGSHRDMDFFSFLRSSAVLEPYFTQFARIGMDTAHLPPEETFRRLRFPGKQAEQAMFRATGGVNTHKGAIFTLGLLCAAAGRLEKRLRNPERICLECASMTKGIVSRELGCVTPENAATNGQMLYAKYGIKGIRGQAEGGFPAVLDSGLPALKKALEAGLSINDAACAALLYLIRDTQDTNLITRSDPDRWKSTVAGITALLETTPLPTGDQLRALDREFIRENLSPGGSADLLAASLFLLYLGE